MTACADAAGLADGQYVLVDGGNGEVVADPSDDLVADARRRREALAERRARSHGPGRTADGVSIPLLVNLGGPSELSSSARADSEGVGLLRTEFLFQDRATAPTFEEQRDSYRSVFEAFAGRRVVVRMLDAPTSRWHTFRSPRSRTRRWWRPPPAAARPRSPGAARSGGQRALLRLLAETARAGAAAKGSGRWASAARPPATRCSRSCSSA